MGEHQSGNMDAFAGDLSKLWSLHDRPFLHHLTWDWWWWLVMLEDEGGNPSGKQLMILWSTKDNPLVEVNQDAWEPNGRPGLDEHGALNIDGMVCAWWYDGKVMHEPLVAEKCTILSMPDTHPAWPHRKISGDDESGFSQAGEQEISQGGGAVIPLLDQDLSMGLTSDRKQFWLNIERTGLVDSAKSNQKLPSLFKLKMTPSSSVMSTAKHATATYAADMGYDILRLHGCNVSGTIDDLQVAGTAYFQKVKVQAPSVPWYWGVLHLSDGSYIDWFLPHASPTLTARDARPWKKRDIAHIALSQGGLFHDASRNRSEKFSKVTVSKRASESVEGKHSHNPGAPLPVFDIKMWNGRCKIEIEATAVDRANWRFDQPTRGGLTSHLTYNEYPLNVKRIRITDEFGTRSRSDFDWIRGNAEHAWGLLH